MREEDGEFSETFAEFDAFVESLAGIRESVVSIIDYPKVQAMQFAYAAIRKALNEAGCGASVVCKQLEVAPDVGAVIVEGKEIDMRNLEWFCRAAEFADNTEIYPLKNGDVRMVFGFNNFLNRLEQ